MFFFIIISLFFFYFFFFSSRRRHTRSLCDWSSDVCSSDLAYLHGRDPADVAKQLCDGGSDLVQLRAKHLAIDEVRRMAEKIEPIVRSSGAALVINDYPQLALEIGAPYCHLGQEDFSAFGRVREVTSGTQSLKIGLSSHSPDQA